MSIPGRAYMIRKRHRPPKHPFDSYTSLTVKPYKVRTRFGLPKSENGWQLLT